MKFKTIVADPPWQFVDKLDKTRKKPYPTMDYLDIASLPVRDLADEKAHLYLWCPHSFFKEVFKVITYWGFIYKIPIVWRKLTKHRKLHFGMGHYFRSSVEFCFFATKNNAPTLTRNTRNEFEAIKPSLHSSKPDEFFEVYPERNSEPPRLELFGRKEREGWTVVGKEIDGRDITRVLNELTKK